ncbi:MAG: septum formation initiator family protein [Arthrobacter sp.]
MATRRPKVPRATPVARQSKDTSDDADVIRADFGAHRNSSTSTEARPAHPAAKDTSARGAAPKDTSARDTVAGRPGGSARTASPKTGQSAPAAAGNPATPHRPSADAGNGPWKKDPAAGHDDRHDPVPAKAFSGRMLALAVVMIAVTIMLAPTVKIFIDKRAEIAGLEADIAARKAEQDSLKLQVSRWQDPNYVKQQARDRINMVMPGETGYWVFGSDLPAGTTNGQTSAGSAQDPANLPWVDSLWESIRRSATD